MKPAFFGGDRSGISIEFTRSRQLVEISGWYDTCAGIQGEVVSLKEFFERLGITQKDCEKAWKS